MPTINPTSWQRFERILLKLGCQFKRKKGSHRVYWKEGINRPIIVPEHTKDLPVFIIKNNLRVLGVSNKKYLAVLKKTR